MGRTTVTPGEPHFEDIIALAVIFTFNGSGRDVLSRLLDFHRHTAPEKALSRGRLCFRLRRRRAGRAHRRALLLLTLHDVLALGACRGLLCSDHRVNW